MAELNRRVRVSPGPPYRIPRELDLDRGLAACLGIETNDTHPATPQLYIALAITLLFVGARQGRRSTYSDQQPYRCQGARSIPHDLFPFRGIAEDFPRGGSL